MADGCLVFYQFVNKLIYPHLPKGRLKNEPLQILDAQKTIQILGASRVLHQEEREMKGYETLSFTTTFRMTRNTIF